MRGESVLAGAVVLALQTELSARDDERLNQGLSKLDAALQENGLSVTKYFAGMFLVSKVSQVEQYFVEIVRVVSTHYPRKLGSTEFKLSDILEATRDELVARSAEEYITRLTYKRPSEYLGQLAEFLSIDERAIKDTWSPFVEIKARRDLGIHNRWIVNETYLRKLGDAKVTCGLKVGDLICPDIDQLMTIFGHCNDLVNGISAELERAYG